MITFAFDQSLTASGVCILDSEKPILLETITPTNLTGLPRVEFIADRVKGLVLEYKPTVFAMEDYARQARSFSETPLKELGGVVKYVMHLLGYVLADGFGIRNDQKILFVQNQSQMKKFNLGSAKIEDTSYLLKVYKEFGREFKDDNQADAFMHAMYALNTYRAVRGELAIEKLTVAQQEVLLTRALKGTKKGGMTVTKALKLTDPEKLKLLAA